MSTNVGTTFDSVLKEFYEEPIREQLNSEIPLYTVLSKSTRKWEGRRVIFPVHKTRNASSGARAEEATLPAAGNQGYAECRVTAKYNYGRIQLSGQVIEASKGNRGAFVQAVASEIEGMVRDMKNDLNRQLYSDGTGEIAAVETDPGAAATTVQVKWAGDGVAANIGEPGTRWLFKDQSIVFDPATDAEVSTIGSITDEDTFETSANVNADVAINDIIVLGDANGNSYNNEIVGLRGLISTSGTVQNINRATAGNEYWKANALTNSGTARSLSLNLMQLAVDKCAQVGGRRVDMIVGDYTVRREFINLLLPDVRFQPEVLKGGFKGVLSFNGIDFFFDKDVPYNRIFFFDKQNIRIYELAPVKWMDRDGSVLSRVSGKDAYEAILYTYSNLGIDQPNGTCMVSDLTISFTT